MAWATAGGGRCHSAITPLERGSASLGIALVRWLLATARVSDGPLRGCPAVGEFPPSSSSPRPGLRSVHASAAARRRPEPVSRASSRRCSCCKRAESSSTRACSARHCRTGWGVSSHARALFRAVAPVQGATTHPGAHIGAVGSSVGGGACCSLLSGFPARCAAPGRRIGAECTRVRAVPRLRRLVGRMCRGWADREEDEGFGHVCGFPRC